MNAKKESQTANSSLGGSTRKIGSIVEGWLIGEVAIKREKAKRGVRFLPRQVERRAMRQMKRFIDKERSRLP